MQNQDFPRTRMVPAQQSVVSADIIGPAIILTPSIPSGFRGTTTGCTSCLAENRSNTPKSN